MDANFIKRLKTTLHQSNLRIRTKTSKKQTAKTKKKTKLAISVVLPPRPSSTSKHSVDDEKIDSQIQASMFRFLNEKLYKCSSSDASDYFSKDKTAFEIYHKGFQKQLAKWPSDPLIWPEQIIKNGIKKPVVADFGCGDARLALRLKQTATVHSFDLVAVNKMVTVCDMAHTPLSNSSVDVVVFCLALMGTNCRDFIFEANRVLKVNGTLLIVEVASRFETSFKDFLKLLKPFGFKIESWEITKDTYFAHGKLYKTADICHRAVSSLPNITINPCLYKKR